MTRVLYIIVVIAFCSFPVGSLACSLPVTEVIPPDTLDGEFVYVPPLAEIDRFRLRLEEADDVAAVEVYADVHRKAYPANTQTEFRVLHGWGSPADPVVKYIRQETSCGQPEKLEVGQWYVAIVNPSSNPWLMADDKVEDIVEKKGKPSYVYTANGRLPR